LQIPVLVVVQMLVQMLVPLQARRDRDVDAVVSDQSRCRRRGHSRARAPQDQR
jgi:hypothetical protein